jgi:cyclopropane fatty-acyl-phospholipid synthase-like methyltransferase
MKTDIDTWLAGEGEAFLVSLGLKSGHTLLDFGCGGGHYTLPAARVVGTNGRVYALDKECAVLKTVQETAKSAGLGNIVPVTSVKEMVIDHTQGFLDMVLLYDVLHYMGSEKRRETYEIVHEMLNRKGILSVYPKHCKSDEPSWHLSDMTLEAIIEEIETAAFYLEEKSLRRLVHDDDYDQGYVLTFRPTSR